MKNRTQIETKSKSHQDKRQIRERIVWTGPLAWPEGEHKSALADGRFVTVPLLKSQADRFKGRAFRIREFLNIATTVQLEALRGATPLFLTEFLREDRPAAITALRGKGPGGRNVAGDGPKLIEQELRRRGVRLRRTLAIVDVILLSGNKRIIRELRSGTEKIMLQVKAEETVLV